jgi:internalin A
MSDLGNRAGDLAEYWKLGLWFKDGEKNAQLLVQFLDTSTADAPGAGVLELKAQGSDSRGLLREIRRVLLRQKIGEKPKELLTLEGDTMALRARATESNGRVRAVQSKPLPASAFAAFFEDREHRSDDTIDISPQPPKADEKRREVFISYAWGDDTPAGKIRDQAVNALCTALEKDGFRPVRDRDEMRSGDLISAFIRRLTRADLVVAVISDKYLRSPYCMDEIHGLWQKSQEDPALLAGSLVPIVLPEVKIGRLQDRAHYLRYWKAQREELETLQREFGADFSLLSQREFRLVRNFAQDVDAILAFLQDVLMPRKLDAHLDDGFQAVRDALRRRLM